MDTTLRQLIDSHPSGFTIPLYQRRYVWGQVRPGEKDSAAYLMQCLADSYATRKPIFLQALTLTGDSVIDGQQRLTFFALMLKLLDSAKRLAINYECRPDAQQYMSRLSIQEALDDSNSQDIYFFNKTLRTIDATIAAHGIDRKDFLDYVLDNVSFLVIEIADHTQAPNAYKMMNGTKSQMMAADIIKADIMRLASDLQQPSASEWTLNSLRQRYAAEWESWVRWWCRADVAKYYANCQQSPLQLLLKLCLRQASDDFAKDVTYEEFRQKIANSDSPAYQAAKHFFYTLRSTQKKFEEAYADATAYNRIQAIMLLQDTPGRMMFLHRYFVEMDIDEEALLKFYKLSFLGMSTTEILRGDSPSQRFDEMLASIGMADVYHTAAKADAFKLLLRLNIDEDIKLQRRFDFSVWSNRSLEHIYSKSKVWHRDSSGTIYDGNDNPLRIPMHKIESDPSMLHRAAITNYDGRPLSEHCIGNLVLLYGENNSAFGNASFDEKKLMFLAPSAMGVFQSRNLLHSVCVFAGNDWTQQSIIDNYNLTLKNFKLYYGYK